MVVFNWGWIQKSLSICLWFCMWHWNLWWTVRETFKMVCWLWHINVDLNDALNFRWTNACTLFSCLGSRQGWEINFGRGMIASSLQAPFRFSVIPLLPCMCQKTYFSKATGRHEFGYNTNSQCDQLPNGLIAQLVEHCTGIAEIMGSNHVQAWIFRL